MWFKIEKSLILGVILLTSCTQTDIGQFAPLPAEAEELHGELFLADDTSLNVYYDLAVLDSFAIFADFYSDSLLQIRPLSHPERCAKVFYKGNGPDEFVQPLFDRAVAPENRQQLGFIDPNSAFLREPKPRRGLHLRFRFGHSRSSLLRLEQRKQHRGKRSSLFP